MYLYLLTLDKCDIFFLKTKYALPNSAVFLYNKHKYTGAQHTLVTNYKVEIYTNTHISSHIDFCLYRKVNMYINLCSWPGIFRRCFIYY